MLINKVILYKLPIDNSYTNVFNFVIKDYGFDEYKGKSETFDKIDDIFSDRKLEIYTKGADSKYINGNKKDAITITYSETEMSGIFNYNYAIIKGDTNKYLFYFVTDYKINNSLKNVTLYLEWDSWTNNIENINRNKKESFIYQETRHINSVTKDGNNRIITAFGINKDELEVAQTTTIDSETIKFADFSYLDKHYKILWQRLWLDKDATIKTLNYYYTDIADEFSTENTGAIPSLLPVRVVYIPVGAINVKTRQLETFTEYECVGTNTNPLFPNPKYYGKYSLSLAKSGDLIAYNKDKTSTYVINTDLTFHAPLDGLKVEPHNYSQNGNTIHYIRFGSVVSGKQSFINGRWGTIEGGTWLNSPNMILTHLPHSSYPEYIERNDKTKEIVTGNTQTINTSVDEILGMYGSISSAHKEKICYAINQYPYSYKSIVCGSKKFDLKYTGLIPTAKCKYRHVNRLNVTLQVSPKYHTDANPPFDINPLETPIVYSENTGNLVYSIDNLDRYLRENQSSIIASTTSAVAGGSLGVMAGLAMANPITGALAVTGATVATASKIKSQIADLKDINRTQDEYRNLTEIAINNREYQDDIYVIKHQMLKGTPEYNAALNSIHNYGIIVKVFDNPTVSWNTNFDYKQTIDCELPSVTNAQDRKEIERIFDSGVTIWHLDLCPKEALKNLDKRYNNVPYIWYQSI